MQASLELAPITDEDFAIWQENPVTKWMMQAVAARSAEIRGEWVFASWELGRCDREQLLELRARADGYMALKQANYADWCSVLKQIPNAA